MIEVQYNDGRCQILRDGTELCDISIDDAITVKETLIRAGDQPAETAAIEELREWWHKHQRYELIECGELDALKRIIPRVLDALAEREGKAK